MCPEWTFIELARPERFELPTSWFVERRSEWRKCLRRLRNVPLSVLNIFARQAQLSA
jgi:hypothetical protein